eukprot:CAMPEP_0184388272 /NCGR_PEP_ID=MMETSP0007-20130409/11471_1 /TAXON_ID=97485 /ORGANISM="Prymnesium parvum, Strain Texoma1" /LENGTH=56 /DNA_ID=CAMNT_0026737051 /DNA_START=184 /DNA_END=351 /DNA_ORIENTATION=-
MVLLVQQQYPLQHRVPDMPWKGHAQSRRLRGASEAGSQQCGAPHSAFGRTVRRAAR